MGKSKRIFEEERERERLEYLEEVSIQADNQALIDEYWRVHGIEPKKENNDKCEK